jgi:5-oxoprolinase (ATP-hydrolysing)
MRRVFLHPLAGVLSAYGMGLADRRLLREAAVEVPLDAASLPEIERRLDALAASAEAELRGQGGAGAVSAIRRLRLRYQGSDSALAVAPGALDDIRAEFEAAHRRLYGFAAPERKLIVEAVTVEIIGSASAEVTRSAVAAETTAPAEAEATVPMYVEGAMRLVPLYDRARLCPGQRLRGPAIIREATGTTILDSGWQGRLDGAANLILERLVARPAQRAIGTAADPVMLEVFNNLFMSIAEQMGEALRNTAQSVNIKERLDFSCALFDAEASLIANAPHMPVHLGSMGESVLTVIRSRGDRRDGRGMLPGDVYALNAPYNGGTHLPDVTVIMPVFAEDDLEGSGAVLFYVASRGHQADIGGISPGSMPPFSRSIAEEGILIDDFLLVDRGRLREAELLALLGSGPYPARNPAQNLADLGAQIAACAKGVAELRHMVRDFGLDVVRAYMRHVQDNAAEAVRRVIDRLEDGRFRYALDDGSAVEVAISIHRQARRAVVDFAGTSAQLPNNFNAPSSICKAAVLYVFRTLVDDEIPMNGGCLAPIEIRIPAGSMLNPRWPAAVVAGNVETSQVVTDALYGALGVMAAAQGTMNNFTFGNARHQYYETICGGAGAGPDFDGADAVHTHMTNSRLTDPEVLEWRFPVLVEEFRIRRGSGGAGRHRGGDGVVRRIRFREAMSAAILSNRRLIPPYGMAGGASGAPGRNGVERADGTIDRMGGTGENEVAPGDCFVIETPGGGGFGAPTT